jgi:DNA invertase Pin-like site-specific DNA recombinase
MSTSKKQGMRMAYVRVSTNEQDESLQRDALEAAGCEKFFEDRSSGVLASRPALDKMLEQLRPGDTVVVWRLDRLGRSLQNLMALVEEFNSRSVDLVSLREHIDTTNPSGKLIFHVMAAMSEFERDLIRERTRAGLAAARARGRRGGRPKALTPEKLRAARSMHGSGESIADVAKALGVSRATVYRGLAAPGEAPVHT